MFKSGEQKGMPKKGGGRDRERDREAKKYVCNQMLHDPVLGESNDTSRTVFVADKG